MATPKRSPQCCEATAAISDTKGAVEAAINVAKGNRTQTWEQAVKKTLGGVSRWESAVDQINHDESSD